MDDGMIVWGFVMVALARRNTKNNEIDGPRGFLAVGIHVM
jgi:hypothetical protein